MLGMLLAYDADGNVIATNDQLIQHDAGGTVIGLIDVEAYERAGGELLDAWQVKGAAGAGTWPEWLAGQAHTFQVELEPGWSRSSPDRSPHRIRALVHRDSGHRRERAALEGEIARRVQEKRDEAEARAAELRAALPHRDEHGRFVAMPHIVVEPEPADIRDLVGGPGRPLRLTSEGRTDLWVPPAPIEGRGHLPVVGAKPKDAPGG
jgi:hypothetical protein